jgi:hypothetical protein
MSFANARRGLRIKHTNFEYLTEGAYGIVFVDKAANRIRKIYRRKHEAPASHCAETYETEAKAFEIASADEHLRGLIPEWHGRRSAQIIVDQSEKDVSDESYPDFAFEAEFVQGTFQKFGDISLEERERVGALFIERGITHVKDMSVILGDDGHVHKAIDFATKEIELWW